MLNILKSNKKLYHLKHIIINGEEREYRIHLAEEYICFYVLRDH